MFTFNENNSSLLQTFPYVNFSSQKEVRYFLRYVAA